MEILILIFFILSWFGAGWTILTFYEVIDSETAKRIIDAIDSLATKTEKISPYLALFIFFGPLGLLLKKQLYGDKLNKDL